MPCPGALYVPDGSDNDTDTYKMTMTDIHRDNLEPERVMETFCSPSPRLHNNGNQLRIVYHLPFMHLPLDFWYICP